MRCSWLRLAGAGEYTRIVVVVVVVD